MEDATHEYTPLPTSTSIRLLEINGEDEFGLLQCSLETFNLADNPIYNCLSYTWGHPDRVGSPTKDEDYGPNALFPISCNGGILNVTRNLYGALQKLHQNCHTIAEQPDPRHRTRLHWAAYSGDANMVKHLLYNGADIAKQDVDGTTPFKDAVRQNHHQIADMMINDEVAGRRENDHEDSTTSTAQSRQRRILRDAYGYIESLRPQQDCDVPWERPGTRRNLIWIDALCIDQSQEALVERSSQVNLMGRIYRSAESVVVWLGPENEYTKTALDMISWLADDRLDEKKAFFYSEDLNPSHVNQREALDVLRVDDRPEMDWKALTTFFQLSWFHRVWIIQEVILAKKILIFCGSFQVQYDRLCRISTFLLLSSWAVEHTKRVKATVPIGIGPQCWEIFRQGLKEDGHSILLVRQLIPAKTALATDPRDKIFAVLGFTSPPMNTNDTEATLIANYELTTEEVYTQAMKAILLDAPNLDYLALVDEKPTLLAPGLPSWVPDFNGYAVGRLTPLGLSFRDGSNRVQGYYHAAESLPRHIQFPSAARPTLSLVGSQVDVINRTASSIDDVTFNGGRFIDWLDLILSLPLTYSNGQNRSDVFWRTLTGDLFNSQFPAPGQTRETFKKFLFRKLAMFLQLNGFITAAAHAGFQQHAAKLDRLGLWLSGYEQRLLNEEDEIPDTGQTPEASFTQNFLKAYAWRCLFRTSNGYLGIGAHGLRRNDSVWILAGASVPYVLRKLDNENYALVGEAYVHGIMQGEMIETEGWNLREILVE